jgi:GT2 family glycosyltransferase
MEHLPQVSVVVLNWNAKGLLEECLESLSRSLFPLCDIIVVDNGSSDGSQMMVQELFKNVTLIENKENLVAPAGRNVGLRKAMTQDNQYIYTLDNDLIIEPETINEAVLFMEKNPQIGCLGSIIYYYDRRNIIFNSGNYIDWTQNVVTSRGMNQRDNGQLKDCEEVDYVGTGAMLTRKSIYQQVGLLDEGFIGYGYEDADFGVRVRKAGYKVASYTPSKVWHRPFSTIGNYSFKKKYLEARNAIRFLKMYGNRWSWLKFSFYASGGLVYATFKEGSRGNIKGVIGKARGLYDGLWGREALARSLLKR